MSAAIVRGVCKTCRRPTFGVPGSENADICERDDAWRPTIGSVIDGSCVVAVDPVVDAYDLADGRRVTGAEALTLARISMSRADVLGEDGSP